MSFQPRRRNVMGGRLNIEEKFYRRLRSGSGWARFKFPSTKSQRGIVFFARASAAEGATSADNFALEVNALTTIGANHAWTLEARKVLGWNFDLHPFLRKKNVVGKLCICLLLTLFFRHLGEHFLRRLLGRFLGGDAHGTAGFEIAESGGDLAPVAEFEGALA